MKRVYIFNSLYPIFITLILSANLFIFKSFKIMDPKELDTWWLHHILWVSIYLLPLCIFMFLFSGLKIKFLKPYKYYFIINLVVIALILLFNIDFVIWFLD